MRNVSLAVRVVILVAVVVSFSAVGQQPAVLLYPATSIDLPVEPARLPAVMTIGDAARRNDFPTFDALYTNASPRDAAAYRELHAFWKWSLTDPVGGFYGDELHAKLSSEYPDYAEYIAEFGIIDAHGRAYYPSAETRAFLLKKAEGRHVAVVADATPVVVKKPVGAVATKHVAEPPVVAAKPVGKHVVAAKPVVKQVAAAKPLVKHAVARKPKKTAMTKPVVVAIATPAVVDAPVAVQEPVVVAPATPKPVVKTAAVTPKPVEVVVKKTASKHVAAPPENARFGRGLMLIFAGLVALGMLSLMFSTAGEAEEPARQQRPEPMHVIHVDEKPKKTA